jgi:hypothetical protein
VKRPPRASEKPLRPLAPRSHLGRDRLLIRIVEQAFDKEPHDLAPPMSHSASPTCGHPNRFPAWRKGLVKMRIGSKPRDSDSFFQNKAESGVEHRDIDLSDDAPGAPPPETAAYIDRLKRERGR